MGKAVKELFYSSLGRLFGISVERRDICRFCCLQRGDGLQQKVKVTMNSMDVPNANMGIMRITFNLLHFTP